MCCIYYCEFQRTGRRHKRADYHRQVGIGEVPTGGIAVKPQFKGIRGVLVVEVQLDFEDVIGVTGAGLYFDIGNGTWAGARLQVDQRGRYTAMAFPFTNGDFLNEAIGVAGHEQPYRHIIPAEAFIENAVEIDTEEIGEGRAHQFEVKANGVLPIVGQPQVVDGQALERTAGAGHTLYGIAHPAAILCHICSVKGINPRIVTLQRPYGHR